MAVIYEKRSKYQLIQLRTHPLYPDEVALFLDNSWQLDTFRESRYHESLITLPLATANSLNRILICGGGDGMSVRECLKFKDTKEVILAEIDEDVIDLFKNGEGKKYNNNALNDRRVEIKIGDALKYVETCDTSSFDVISLDFPSPTKFNKDKNYPNLFTPEIWDKFLNVLDEDGLLTSQVSVSTHVLAKLVKHLLQKGYRVWHWDTAYSNRGNHDSFLMASKCGLRKLREFPINCRFATEKKLNALLNSMELGSQDLEYYREFHYCDFDPYENEEEDYE